MPWVDPAVQPVNPAQSEREPPGSGAVADSTSVLSRATIPDHRGRGGHVLRCHGPVHSTVPAELDSREEMVVVENRHATSSPLTLSCTAYVVEGVNGTLGIKNTAPESRRMLWPISWNRRGPSRYMRVRSVVSTNWALPYAHTGTLTPFPVKETLQTETRIHEAVVTRRRAPGLKLPHRKAVKAPRTLPEGYRRGQKTLRSPPLPQPYRRR